MKQCIKTLVGGGFCVVVMTSGASLSQAETIGQVVQRQQELSILDHRIDRNERLLELQEQQLEMTEIKQSNQPRPKPKAQGNTQVEYFGQRPPQGGNNQGQGGEQREIVKPAKSDAEKRRERILTTLDDAVLTEAYVPKDNPGGGFVGVISMSGRNYKVRKSSVIEGWKSVSVELDRVVFENQEFEVRKTVFQAR